MVPAGGSLDRADFFRSGMAVTVFKMGASSFYQETGLGLVLARTYYLSGLWSRPGMEASGKPGAAGAARWKPTRRADCDLARAAHPYPAAPFGHSWGWQVHL